MFEIVAFSVAVGGLASCGFDAPARDGRPAIQRAAVAEDPAAGLLDETLGDDGVVVFDSGVRDLGKAVTVQRGLRGERLLVVGKTGVGGATDFLLVRFDATGRLDKQFGPNRQGFVTTNFAGGSADEGKAVAIQPDVAMGGAHHERWKTPKAT